MDLFDLFLKILVLSFFIGIYLGIPYFIYRAIKEKNRWVLLILISIYAFAILFAWAAIDFSKGSSLAEIQIKVTNTNHSNNKSFIAAVLTKCSSGSSKVSINNVDVDCTDDKLKPAFIAYFKDINKNPYDDTVASMLEGGGTPALGQSLLAVDGKKYTLKTNIGNEDGSDVYLKDTMVYK
jgi:type IV pilus assembly protein PilA